jgi:hypothetical protein
MADALVRVEKHYKDGEPRCHYCALFAGCAHSEMDDGYDIIAPDHSSVYHPGPDCPVWYGNALRDALIEYQTWYDEFEGCDTADMAASDMVEHYLKLKAFADGTWPPKKGAGGVIIPTKDGWYLCTHPKGWYAGHGAGTGEIAELYHGTRGGLFFGNSSVTANEGIFEQCTFMPITLPPADGKEYACVWVEVKRDEQKRRTCWGCEMVGNCTKSVFLTSIDRYGDNPGPDCPLGIDA